MTEALDSAERINAKLAQVLRGEYPDDRRVTITLAYYNLAMDHHTAIILLFRNGLYGSGVAAFEEIVLTHVRTSQIS